MTLIGGLLSPPSRLFIGGLFMRGIPAISCTNALRNIFPYSEARASGVERGWDDEAWRRMRGRG